MTIEADRLATQAFAVQNELTTYFGMRLTHDTFDKIVAALVREMREGGTAWAFQQAKWVKLADRRPAPGCLIVKRWVASGSVWAGVYSGSDKDSSFDEWIELP